MDADPAMQKQTSLFEIVKLTEAATGLRFCISCNTMLPMSAFKPTQKRHRCSSCFKTMKREYLSTKLQRAYNSILCRARRDKEFFGQTKTALSTQDLFELLTTEQIENFNSWVVVPKEPNLVLTKSNARIIPAFQRRYLITEWRNGQDRDLYMRRLEALPV